MHADRDFDVEAEPPPNADALIQDLELETLFDAMAAGDGFLRTIAGKGLLAGLRTPEEIRYRQHALADCLAHEAAVREIYGLAVEAVDAPRKASLFFGLRHASPGMILHSCVRVLEVLVDVLERLRKLADEDAPNFRSEAFGRFFGMLQAELDDEYLGVLRRYLKELKFDRGELMSVRLGRGNKGVGYVLRRPRQRGWLERLPGQGPPSRSFTIPPRDEAGFKALDDLRGRGINLVANAVGQSTDHIVGFFTVLRAELAFYLAAVNLHMRLTEKGEPVCFPEPVDASAQAFLTEGLYDAALTLHLDPCVVGNDVDANGRSLVMITGANQGGKSTFLRSTGIAQLLMQSGLFAPAAQLRASVVSGVFTHYKREEDKSMDSGKLDEELARMSAIADEISPGCLLLCNESFAATNEREGSEIARQVVRAMLDSGVRMFFVTHLFDLAQSLHAQDGDTNLFLRAERGTGGRRTFSIAEGAPLPTSYGEDSYHRVFGTEASTAAERSAG
jgi:hypothetical protein